MKKQILGLLLAVLSSSFLLAMEKEKGKGVTLHIEDNSYLLSLEKVLSHIGGYQVLQVGQEIDISGFHWYKPVKIETIAGQTVCKVAPYLWVVALGDTSSFHKGYVIYKGQVCRKTKTFFPSSWTLRDIQAYIENMHQESTTIIEEDREQGSESYKVYLIKRVPFPASKYTTGLQMVVRGCPQIKESMHILTLYPDCPNASLVTLANLRSLATMQVKEAAKRKEVTKQPELLHALESGRYQEALQLLEAGADPSIVGPGNITPLMVVAKAGQWQMVNVLLEYGADKTVQDRNGNTALHYAVLSDDYYSVWGLIDSKLVTVDNREGHTPLMLAVLNKHINSVSVLLGWDCTIDRQDTFGRTALIHAVANIAHTKNDLVLSKAIVELLLRHGASVDIQDKSGTTALSYGVSYNRASIVELLLRAHADYTIRNGKGESALSLAKKSNNTCFTCIQKAIEQKESWIRDYEATEFLYAAYANDSRTVKRLISSVSDSNRADNRGWTALAYAAENDNLELVSLLLEAGADPCVTLSPRLTLDLYVAEHQHISSEIKKLIATEAEKRYKALQEKKKEKAQEENARRTILHEAIVYNTISLVPLNIIETFKNRPLSKDGCTPLLYAIREKKHTAVKQLIACGSALDKIDKNGRDALQIACDNADDQMISLLIDSGALKGSSIELCFTRLLEAKKHALARIIAQKASHCAKKVALTFIQDHAEAKLIELLKETVLDTTQVSLGELLLAAVEQADAQLVKVILKYALQDINYTNAQGETALIIATKLGYLAVIQALCEAGADMHKKDRAGNTAFVYAQGNKKLLDLLSEQEVKRKQDEIQAQQKAHAKRLEEKFRSQGATDLMMAAYFNRLDEVKASAEDINAQDTIGRTALMFAIVTGSPEILEILLQRSDIDVNLLDKGGNHALWYALKHKRYDIAQMLINAGAWVNVLNRAKEFIPHLVEQSDAPASLKAAAQQCLQKELGILARYSTRSEYTATDAASYFKKFASHLNGLNDADKVYFIDILIELGRTDILKIALAYMHFPVNTQGKGIVDPLCYAITLDRGEMIIALLEYYSAVSVEPVILALNQEKLALAQFLLGSGKVKIAATMQGAEERGKLLDTLCRIDKQGKLLPSVLRFIPDINGCYPYGSPLHIACYEQNPTIVRLLLEAGAQVNNPDTDKWMPLHEAVAEGNSEIVSLLVEAGASLDAQDKSGNTPLHRAAEHRHTAIVKQLLALGAKATLANDSKVTPIVWALAYSDLEMLKLFIGKHIPIDAKVGDGHTPLMLAAQCGQMHITEFLINAGADINFTCNHGHTALMMACFQGYKEIAQLLIRAGALMAVTNQGQSKIMNIFLKEFPKGALTIKELLLENRIALDVTKPDIINLFSLACIEGQTEIALHLLKCGINPNAQSQYGVPLLLACDSGNRELVRELLKAGADANAYNYMGLNALQAVCMSGNADIVKLLLAYGADVNMQARLKPNESGKVPACFLVNRTNESRPISASFVGDTPLMIASFNGYKDIVELLLATGKVDFDLRNGEGHTVLELMQACIANPEIMCCLSFPRIHEIIKKDVKILVRDAKSRAQVILKLLQEYLKRKNKESQKK